MSATQDIQVTMQALLDASGGIDAVIDDMQNHDLKAVDDLGSNAGAYGHERLAGAVQGFGEAWSYGLSRLVRDATELSQALHAAAKTYAETEHINIDQFQAGR